MRFSIVAALAVLATIVPFGAHARTMVVSDVRRIIGISSPRISPDGKHIVFRSSFSGMTSIDWIRADGAGEVQRLLEGKNEMFPHSFFPDGHRLAYFGGAPRGLWTLPLDLSDPEHPKPGKPEIFLSTPSNAQAYPAFSPDGRWIAYESNESGSIEVYVRPFPGPGGKWQISTGRGIFPIWSQNGRELFYETPSPDNRIMVAEYIAKGDSFLAGKPHLWSDKQIYNTTLTNLDLAPDGKRFAVFPRADAADESKGAVHVTFLLNFFDELRRRVPAGK